MELDALLQQMHDAGDLDSEGHFTVAGREAAARLATFSKNIPLYVLLRLVQAGVCAGVDAIQINDSPKRSVVRFRGGQWSPAELQVLTQDLGRGITAPDDRPLHHLAFALGSSLGAGEDVRVKVTSTSQLEVSLPGSLGLVMHSAIANSVQTIARLHAVPVELDHFDFALAGTVAAYPCKPAYDPPSGTLAELVRGQPQGRGVAPIVVHPALHEAPGRSPFGLPWTGLVLRHWQTEDVPRVATTAGFLRGTGQLRLPRSHLVAYVGSGTTTKVEFIKYGVSVAQQLGVWGLPVTHVVVEADDLPMDLSGLTPLDNGALEQRMEAVRTEVLAALRDARAHLARQRKPRGGPPDWLGYGAMAAGFGLGVVTWQPAFPIAGMAASAMLFGVGGTQQSKVKAARTLQQLLDRY